MCRVSLAARVAVLAAVVVVGGASTAPAQDEPPQTDLAPPLRVLHLEGDVSLVRDGVAEVPEPNAPLIEGDRFRTNGGRAALGLARGAILFLDRHTSIDLRTVTRVRLLEGRLRLASPGSSEPPDLVIDAPGATVTPSSVTAFLLEATAGPRGDEVVVRVEDGVVEFAGDRDTLLVRAGESASMRAGGPPTPASGYTRAERNEFDIWVEERLRDDEPRATTASESSYLPDELGAYSGTLSRYGTWDTEPEYGNVWYPTVEADWRPYSVGRWDRVGAYGWFWVGADPWAWPTHHYGRWGYRSGRWFWVPRRTWAPAWVSWSIGPGYVGWCPLGYDDRPVFGFGFGYNSWGSSYYRGRGYYGRDDYWRGWSVLHSDRFYSRRYHYGRDYVDARRLSRDVTSAFVTQRVPPAWRGSRYAVPRYGTPRGPWGGGRGEIGDTRVDTPRGPAYGGPGSARPRGESSTGAEPYERARPYMDRRNVPGRDPGAEPYERARPYLDRRNTPGRDPGAQPAPGAEPYERARPYTSPRTGPGATRPERDPDGGLPPRGSWGQERRAAPRAEPREDAPRYAPRPERPRTTTPPSGDGGWGARSRGERRFDAPRARPSERAAPRGEDRPAPRSFSRPEPRSYTPPPAPSRGESRRSWGGDSGRSWGGGAGVQRSTPRGSDGGGSRDRGGSRGDSRGRSRSPRG